MMGMIIASCGNAMYGKTYWVRRLLRLSRLFLYSDAQNLWDFFNATLDVHWGPGARTLVFLAALTQVYATFVTNISSNSIPV